MEWAEPPGTSPAHLTPELVPYEVPALRMCWRDSALRQTGLHAGGPRRRGTPRTIKQLPQANSS